MATRHKASRHDYPYYVRDDIPELVTTIPIPFQSFYIILLETTCKGVPMKHSVICLLLTTTFSFSQIISSVDFENRTEGIYTNTFAKEDFIKKDGASSWYAMDKNNSENAKIVYDSEEHGMVLQLKYPAGCVGPNDSDSAKACAGQIKQPLTQPAEEMWLAYDILFEEGFEFVLGGKLPGLCGGKCYTGGNRPSTGDGWSARIMWRQDGQVVQYLYFVEQASIYGDDAKWNLGETKPIKQFIPGKWHRLVTRIKLNSVPTEGHGDKNGIVQSWFDGELALDLDTLRLRDFANEKIDIFYLSTFHGGSNLSWSPTKDVFARYDNFIVSLDSIPVSSKQEILEKPDSSVTDSSTALFTQKVFMKENPKLISGKFFFLKTPLSESQTFKFYNLDGKLIKQKNYPKGTKQIPLPQETQIFILKHDSP